MMVVGTGSACVTTVALQGLIFYPLQSMSAPATRRTCHATSIFNWFCAQFPYSTASLLPGVTVTDPSQWPGWNDIRDCVQNAIVNYNMLYAGCADWIWVCEHGSIAEADILSAAISECSSNEPDIAVATSIFNGFCSQLPGVTDFQYIAMSPMGLSAGAGATAPTCNHSSFCLLI
jgi:hypothetical protein